MATLIPIPKLGQSEEMVSIVKWRKAEGDVVRKGDVLFELETDKAVLEVESQFEGTLLKILVPAGKEVPVMTIGAVVGTPGEALPPIPAPPPVAPEKSAASAKPAPKATAPSPLRPVPAAPGAAPPAISLAPAAVPAPAAARKKAVSPRARKFGGDFLIRVADVPGTGPGGRVTENDVRNYLESSGYHQRLITPTAFSLAKQLGFAVFDLEPTGETGRITIADVQRAEAERPKPLSKLRQLIARRLQQSKQTIPHFYTTVSVDVTDLLALRKESKASGLACSFTDFILKAVATALSEFPAVNSHTDDGLSARWSSSVNLGLAVALDNGVVVPVIRNAAAMRLDELHDVAAELIAKARAGKLQPQEMQGGTFTVSNMGMLNVENFAAIINPGESAILAVSSPIPSAVVDRNRAVVVRDMMKITLSADHRLVDGATAAAFVNAVRRRLQDVKSWKVELGLMPTADAKQPLNREPLNHTT